MKALLAINYAFQQTFSWGGRTWPLSEDQLREISYLVAVDEPEKTGSALWKWFHERHPDFVTGRPHLDRGKEFIKHMEYYSGLTPPPQQGD